MKLFKTSNIEIIEEVSLHVDVFHVDELPSVQLQKLFQKFSSQL